MHENDNKVLYKTCELVRDRGIIPGGLKHEKEGLSLIYNMKADFSPLKASWIVKASGWPHLLGGMKLPNDEKNNSGLCSCAFKALEAAEMRE